MRKALYIVSRETAICMRQLPAAKAATLAWKADEYQME